MHPQCNTMQGISIIYKYIGIRIKLVACKEKHYNHRKLQQRHFKMVDDCD